MDMDIKKFIPGLRILKTSLAVFVCMTLFYLIGYFYPIHALIACVLMMKETSEETKKAGIDRIKGTLLGGSLSYVALIVSKELQIDSTHLLVPVILSLSIFISFIMVKGFEQSSSVASMSAVMIIITLMSHASSTNSVFIYVSTRTIETLVGILIAFIINKSFKVS